MRFLRIKTVFRIMGAVLALCAGFFALFSLGLVLMAKGDSVRSTVGAGWPLLAVTFAIGSVYFLRGAPHLARALERRR